VSAIQSVIIRVVQTPHTHTKEMYGKKKMIDNEKKTSKQMKAISGSVN
jgi:hypothetical protein